jgi:pimeloyl-ACP methyl ester carboxylesterase
MTLLIIVIIIVALIGAGALVTLAGSLLIARAHPPRGRRVDVDGLLQHAVDLGPGHAGAGASALPLVLLHGAGCNLEDMRLALGEQLAARHRVILIDRPGAGWSARSGRRWSAPAAQAAMLREVLDRLGVLRAIVIGHSWGGALALAFALDHPQRTAALVLLSPPTHPRLRRLARLYGPLAAPIFGWLFAHTLALPLAGAAFGAGIRAAFAPQRPPRHYLKNSAAFLLLRPRAFIANACDMADLQVFLAGQARRYGELTMPMVIVQGGSDGIVPLEKHATTLAAAVPHARLVVLPGTGHMPHYAATDRVLAEIENVAATSK